MSKRFQLEYTDINNEKKQPIIIHRALFGSLERFIAILIENTKGKFPFWIAPEQIILIPISKKYNQYSIKIYKLLKSKNIICNINEKNEQIGKKIINAKLKKIPYILIIGKKEYNNNIISIKTKIQKEIKINKFIKIINKKI